MSRITATTQDHLDIADVKNDMIILKNGGACVILEARAINFDLLSMQEQDAAISAYSSLLNSLSFPIQVTVKSKLMDITEYLEKVKELEGRQFNQKIKEQLRSYRHFIQDELVTKEGVLDKKFYVTIPYKIFAMTQEDAFGWVNDLLGIGTKQKGKSKINVDKIAQEASADLEPKKNFLIKEFARIGVRTKPLTSEEIIKLFYEIYNAETAQAQKIRGNPTEYTAALVEPRMMGS